MAWHGRTQITDCIFSLLLSLGLMTLICSVLFALSHHIRSPRSLSSKAHRIRMWSSSNAITGPREKRRRRAEGECAKRFTSPSPHHGWSKSNMLSSASLPFPATPPVGPDTICFCEETQLCPAPPSASPLGCSDQFYPILPYHILSYLSNPICLPSTV